MKLRLATILAVIWCFASGAAAPVRMTPVKVTEGVYMLEHSQGSGNSTVIFTDEGVGTQVLPGATKRLRSALYTTSGKDDTP